MYSTLQYSTVLYWHADRFSARAHHRKQASLIEMNLFINDTVLRQRDSKTKSASETGVNENTVVSM